MTNEKKEIKLDTRVTKSQYDALEKTAKQHNTNISTLSREILFKESPKHIDLQKSYLLNILRLSGIRSDAKKNLYEELIKDEKCNH